MDVEPQDGHVLLGMVQCPGEKLAMSKGVLEIHGKSYVKARGDEGHRRLKLRCGCIFHIYLRLASVRQLCLTEQEGLDSKEYGRLLGGQHLSFNPTYS